jgi:undecaprenyl-diphosphatase
MAFTFISDLDYHLSLAATKWAESTPATHLFVYICAQVLIVTYLAALYFLWRKPEPVAGKIDRHSAKKAVILAIVVVVAAVALKTLISGFWLRPRPFLTHSDLAYFTFSVDPPSFPSGHTMIAFAIAYSLYLSGYRRLGFWLLIVAVFVAFGRVASGVHYTTDVLGGAFIAILTTWYFHRESSTLKRYLPDS